MRKKWRDKSTRRAGKYGTTISPKESEKESSGSKIVEQ